MNEYRPATRPTQPPDSVRSTRRPPQSYDMPRHASRSEQTPSARSRSRSRRRRKQVRQAKIAFVLHQIILILVALLIGYLIGSHAGNAAAPAVPTGPAESPSSAASEPSEPTLPPDTTAPQILGVNKLSMFKGAAIAYRRGVLVTDDQDPSPKLSVDNSQVDLSTPGVYPLIYTATDSAGNVTVAETTVTVLEPTETYVNEATIKATADRILDYILTEGMTKEQQVNAIYDYMANHCGYIGEFDKSDYMQAAYVMMTENQGDCFGFYALARLMFERLDIDNLSVTRMKNELRTTSHYWNMVSLDDGKTWYHFDATPHFTYPTRTCLITDEDLEEFNELMPGYYFFDHEAYPATP